MSDLGQQLIKNVRAHAANNPDFVYEVEGFGGSCVYVHNGCASCLIGQALWDAGIIDASLEGHGLNHVPVFSISEALELSIDQDELNWLRDAQYWQDLKYSWAEAVHRANNNYPNNYGNYN